MLTGVGREGKRAGKGSWALQIVMNPEKERWASAINYVNCMTIESSCARAIVSVCLCLFV